MDTAAIKQTIQKLTEMGVVWLGLTGGEPLLNEDIVEIVESVRDDCTVKLFTTGYNLTTELAVKLKEAGIDYVSVSLDHWQEEQYDELRNWPGAFKTALQAIEVCQEVAGLHLSVSSVLTREMITEQQVEKFLDFLTQLKIDEAWLSEVKPAVPSLWDEKVVITEQEREELINLQDRYNQELGLTVNYLGHFESKTHFC